MQIIEITISFLSIQCIWRETEKIENYRQLVDVFYSFKSCQQFQGKYESLKCFIKGNWRWKVNN